ncbi:RICIN domain-containing protein [Streptacidiphilus griseoplanus]|uniref:RICIN domain-containing protein n=1 Tax=Peterkaempfera griseoplana TaxID=66896 RepID=UPI000B1847AE|nr:RICIN domain-containing protein [Peterkaempfera griseoplana]
MRRTSKRSALIAATGALGLALVPGVSAHATAVGTAAPTATQAAPKPKPPTESAKGAAAKVARDAVYVGIVTNGLGGQCLDGDTNTIPGNGAKVQLWDCNGQSQQRWYWYPVAGAPTGWYTIKNGLGGQCLDGDRNTMPNDGTRVQLWACNGWQNQQWRWDGQHLRNALYGQCMDADRNTIPSDGTRVQLWACNGWSNQQWTFSS